MVLMCYFSRDLGVKSVGPVEPLDYGFWNVPCVMFAHDTTFLIRAGICSFRVLQTHLLLPANCPILLVENNIVACSVTRHGGWFGNWIYCTLINRSCN